MQHTIAIKNVVLGQGMPKICVPMVGATHQKIEEEAAISVKAGADIVEWRADCFEGVSDSRQIAKVLAVLPSFLHGVPLLFTIRSKTEGGNCGLQPDEIRDLLLTAIKSGCVDAVDVEFSLGDAICKEIVEAALASAVVPVLSSHDFEKTPSEEEMLTKLKAMKKLGAVVPKIAVMPGTPQDVLRLLGVTTAFSEQNGPVITMAMGWLGSISRVAGEFFGSSVTFGAGENASAPGQLPIEKLKEALTMLHSPDK